MPASTTKNESLRRPRQATLPEKASRTQSSRVKAERPVARPTASVPSLGTRLLEFSLDNAILDRKLGSNSRYNRQGKARLTAAAQSDARLQMLNALNGVTFEPPLVLECHRFYGGKAREMDEHDNLRSCFKPYVDGIALALWPDLAVGRGDDKELLTIEYFQHKTIVGNWLKFRLVRRPPGSYCYLSDRQKALILAMSTPGVLDGVKLDYSATEIAELRNYIQAMLSVKEYVK